MQKFILIIYPIYIIGTVPTKNNKQLLVQGCFFSWVKLCKRIKQMIYIIVSDTDAKPALKMQNAKKKARRSKMFKIEPESKMIKITRGDIGYIEVGVKNDDDTAYIFKEGDVVRFKVFKKKDCGCIELQKDVTATAGETLVQINLTSEDTKIGGLISKPTDYWYEVELNPETAPQTIIGYDDMGEKVFKLYPEGSDEE